MFPFRFSRLLYILQRQNLTPVVWLLRSRTNLSGWCPSLDHSCQDACCQVAVSSARLPVAKLQSAEENTQMEESFGTSHQSHPGTCLYCFHICSCVGVSTSLYLIKLVPNLECLTLSSLYLLCWCWSSPKPCHVTLACDDDRQIRAHNCSLHRIHLAKRGLWVI